MLLVAGNAYCNFFKFPPLAPAQKFFFGLIR